MRIRKGTNFSANHNRLLQVLVLVSDVCGYAKVLIFLQITTIPVVSAYNQKMYADTQRY